MQPTNEAETIALFETMQERLNWRIIHLQRAFPDAVIENGDGVHLVAEFEHKAKNFEYHGHDPNGCDLVIAWENNWPDAPLPIWALADGTPEIDPLWLTWERMRVDALLAKRDKYIATLKYEVDDLKSKVNDLEIRLGETENRISFFERRAIVPLGSIRIGKIGNIYYETPEVGDRVMQFLYCVDRLLSTEESPDVEAALDSLGL